MSTSLEPPSQVISNTGLEWPHPRWPLPYQLIVSHLKGRRFQFAGVIRVQRVGPGGMAKATAGHPLLAARPDIYPGTGAHKQRRSPHGTAPTPPHPTPPIPLIHKLTSPNRPPLPVTKITIFKIHSRAFAYTHCADWNLKGDMWNAVCGWRLATQPAACAAPTPPCPPRAHTHGASGTAGGGRALRSSPATWDSGWGRLRESQGICSGPHCGLPCPLPPCGWPTSPPVHLPLHRQVHVYICARTHTYTHTHS